MFTSIIMLWKHNPNTLECRETTGTWKVLLTITMNNNVRENRKMVSKNTHKVYAKCRYVRMSNTRKRTCPRNAPRFCAVPTVSVENSKRQLFRVGTRPPTTRGRKRNDPMTGRLAAASEVPKIPTAQWRNY